MGRAPKKLSAWFMDDPLPVCWKLELEGNQDMTEDVEVTLEALTHEGPRGASFPMIMVHAASLEVLRFTVTDLTLMR